MNITVLDRTSDKVIKSEVIVIKTDYEVALNKLVPLIDRLEFQRNPLRAQFYEKLSKDILAGCIMPPLTLAIIDPNLETDDLEQYITENIDHAFVLDGIQRLNTLKRIATQNLDLTGTLYVNVLICNSMDKLLYRMITLNNGQRPMSARHQVEILLGNIYDFENLPIVNRTEREQQRRRVRGAFKKEDLIKAYMAFMSRSINIDNQKIIEQKLDELIVGNIIDSDVTQKEYEFSDLVNIIAEFSQNERLKKWFEVANNLIGFSAGSNQNFGEISEATTEEFEDVIEKFESAFESLDLSKIKLGTARRRSVQTLIEKYSSFRAMDVTRMLDEISLIV